jgi:hypothetical protein
MRHDSLHIHAKRGQILNAIPISKRPEVNKRGVS